MVPAKKLWIVLIVLSALGCAEPTKVIKDPNAPMVVSNVDRFFNRIEVYIESSSGHLVYYGWVPFTKQSLEGMTIHRYDWEKHFNETIPHKGNTDGTHDR